MKNLVLTIMAMWFGVSIATAETTFDVRLSEVSNDGSTYIMKIEMQMFGEDPATFKLGSTAIQFTYPQEAISNPTLYSHAFGDTFFYLDPTVTTPIPGECSFNIELTIPNMGITIPTGEEWIELGEISFTVENLSSLSTPTLVYNGGTTKTVVYLDDESTQIFMEAEVTSVEEAQATTAHNLVAYPNPNDGEAINVELSNVGVNQKVIVEISDMLGKIVYSTEVTSSENALIKKVKFDQQLVKGAYSINLTVDGNVITKKFVVE